MKRETIALQPAMTFTEIAAELGCTRQAAEQSYNRAIRKLRAHGMPLARSIQAYFYSRREYAANTDGIEAFIARWD